MTTISFDVPDDLAVQILPVKQHLPRALSLAINLLGESTSTSYPPERSLAIEELVDFLLSQPSHAEMISFKISPLAQARLEELLDRNRESALTPSEQAELNTYQQANHLLILLKSRARSAIAHAN